MYQKSPVKLVCKKYDQENIYRFHFSVRNISTEFFSATERSYFSLDQDDRFDRVKKLIY
jgi:hypothetical protein